MAEMMMERASINIVAIQSFFIIFVRTKAIHRASTPSVTELIVAFLSQHGASAKAAAAPPNGPVEYLDLGVPDLPISQILEHRHRISFFNRHSVSEQ